MELLTLRTFLAVVEEGGVLAASRKLNTVQSNITNRIQRLEEEFGNELFHRQGRGLTLAPAGRVLRGYAEQMLALASRTEKAMRSVGDNSGELRVGTMESFAAVRLPAALMQVRARHQGLGLKVETNPTQQLIERVLSHKLDCAFVGGPLEHPGLVVETVLIEELVLVSAKGMDRSDMPLILFREGCAYRARALNWQRECGHPHSDVMEMGTLDGILGCVAVGMGFTLMPRGVVSSSAYADQLQVSGLKPSIAQVPTVMIALRDNPPLDAMLTLKQAVLNSDSRQLAATVA
ncbi:LysR substrate-binding domain-containing protein [Motiliproteus sediminis]|uniref:LysR substrate-binding domain-containing protein n=1 Tax=Motiliproteus sediminis TaxID=1468178 RepID=UPI001AF00ED5|nr:LysR substrate-binding domain-containing protein [Motiliproteus sediminis]